MSKILTEFNALTPDEQNTWHKTFKEFATNPQLSYQNIATNFTESTGIKTDRKSIAKLIDELGYPKRTPEMIRESKKALGTRGKALIPKEHELLIQNVGEQQLKEEYATLSLSKMAQLHSTTTYIVENALTSLNVPIKINPITFIQILEILQEKGITKEEIKNTYLDGRSFAEFQTWIQQQSGHKISSSSTIRLLRKLEITKPEHLIRQQQGAKSRQLKEARNSKLKSIGFDSPEEVAQFYNQHVELSQEKLINMLNQRIGYDEFNEKWFRNNVQPHVPHHSKNNWGVSREESGLIEWLESVLQDEHTIQRNIRSIIPPREVDIYIPSLRLAIEFNGIPWHTRAFMLKSRGIDAYEFHREKMEDCAAKGVELVYIWSDDWAINKEEIKTLLLQKIENPKLQIPQLSKLLCRQDLIDDASLFMQPQDQVDTKIVAMYNKLGTVNAVAQELQTSRPYVRQALKRKGVDTSQFTYKTVVKQLNDVNIGKKEIYDFYVKQDHTRKEVIEYISSKINCSKPIGMDMLESILKHYEIRKTQ